MTSKRVAVLVSGGGTNLQSLIDAKSRGEIKNGEISCVISSKPDAYALERARKADIPAIVHSRKDYDSIEVYSQRMLGILDEMDIDVVVTAGFMTILSSCVPNTFTNRVINVHPALIPSFCGKGFYGLHVHQAVLEKGVKLTGATVHFVTEGADEGPIILQGAIPVLDNDTPQSLQKRVMEELEWPLLSKAVSLLCEDRIVVKGNRTFILDQCE